MEIWVDADACPTAIREILFRVSNRLDVNLTLVANQPIRVPASRWIRAVQVATGFDVADNEIVRRAQPGDLIITSDVPLAAEVIAKGAHALSPRGERFTKDNIGPRLNIRDFMDTMRASGFHGGGPHPMNNSDRAEFANQLDRLLAKLKVPSRAKL